MARDAVRKAKIVDNGGFRKPGNVLKVAFNNSISRVRGNVRTAFEDVLWLTRQAPDGPSGGPFSQHPGGSFVQ
jgi:hypothetical protein